MARSLLVATWVCAVLLAGCPEPRDAPPPAEAEACGSLADCNCGGECGALDACADGFCEQGRSLLVPCRDGLRERPRDCRP